MELEEVNCISVYEICSNKNHWVWNKLLDYEMQLLVLAALFYPQAIRVLFIGAIDFPNNEHILAPKNL